MNSEDKEILKEFPVLADGRYTYIDNAATTQKPQSVIDRAAEYYERDNANPFRGLYELSERATRDYEDARTAVAEFINAPDSSNIVFTRNASESLNLVAYSYALSNVGEGDEIICSIVEHHSNMLPWQFVAKQKKAKLIYFECDQNGAFDMDKLESLCSDKTKIIAMTQVSNVLGTTNDVKKAAEIAHRHGAVMVADGAQSVPHMPVDVQDLDVDFLAFSGHKIYSPMGIGVLYAKKELLEDMPPFLYGGEMIDYVTLDGAKWAEVPHKFEAGTVNVGGAVGLHEAIKFVNKYGWDLIESRERHLTTMAMEGMKDIPHVRIFGSEDPLMHNGIVTFQIDGVHPHDVSAIFDSEDICVRAGHHCAQPLHKFLCVMSTTRASFAFYNNEDDVRKFLDCLASIRGKMGYKD
ncbi:MAG: cysteine desulfurase [Eubacteriales bacterium]|nr:cysteine desulfurase [Eubacteriales bacterium]